MENLDTLFNFCLIIVVSIIVIYAVKLEFEYNEKFQNYRKARAAKKATNELARKQEALRNLAAQQKLHYTSTASK
jgi:hypothetical protein